MNGPSAVDGNIRVPRFSALAAAAAQPDAGSPPAPVRSSEAEGAVALPTAAARRLVQAPAAEGSLPAPARSGGVQLNDPRPGRGVSITYITDQTDFLMRAMRAITVGEVTGSNLDDLVNGVIAKADGRPISRLKIVGHGFQGLQTLGEHTSIQAPLSPTERAKLARLRPHFAVGALVILEGCQVGGGPRGEQLLRELAEVLGVRIRAGSANQRSLVPGMEGTLYEARPTPNGVQIHTSESMFNEAWRWVPPFQDYFDEARYLRMSREELARLPLEDKYGAMVAMLDGRTTADQKTLIVAMMAASTPEQRRALYRHIEGHPWTGSFRTGIDADSLYRNLDAAQRATLQQLLDEQSPAPAKSAA